MMAGIHRGRLDRAAARPGPRVGSARLRGVAGGLAVAVWLLGAAFAPVECLSAATTRESETWTVTGAPLGQPKPAAPPASQPAPPPPPSQPPPSPTPPPRETYTYDPQGRRDPFVSLIARGSELRGPANRPAGLPGLLVGEVSVRGIIKGPKGFLAMVMGPDKRTYIVHPNDRLFDGTVKAITEDAVIFLQDVSDPLSLVKQREVRKALREGQEGQ